MARTVENWNPAMRFEIVSSSPDARRRRAGFASASVALSELSKQAPPSPSSPPKVDLKPASDVLAGAVARAASQGTIHPLDTLKVRMQAGHATSKFSRLVPPAGSAPAAVVKKALPKIAGLYRGVVGAASGAGIAIGAYFAFYGAASNLLVAHTDLPRGSVAFCAGAMAAAGGSVVKVPLAVCIRSVQAGVYPNFFAAANAIIAAAGPRGLFTGYLPTLLEDVPDMAFKFAAYETLRGAHKRLNNGRAASAQEDFAMGAFSGAFAAAMTTPLDVIKTNMMCTAASRPSLVSATRSVLAQGGPRMLFRGVGPRAISNGINSAVFFCLFEALRASFAQRRAAAESLARNHKPAAATRQLLRSAAAAERVGLGSCRAAAGAGNAALQPATASLTLAAPATALLSLAVPLPCK